jgi:hypothetical protein
VELERQVRASGAGSCHTIRSHPAHLHTGRRKDIIVITTASKARLTPVYPASIKVSWAQDAADCGGRRPHRLWSAGQLVPAGTLSQLFTPAVPRLCNRER